MLTIKTKTILLSAFLLSLAFIGTQHKVVHAAPPGINISCAPDDLSSDKSQICDNSKWVACDSSNQNAKSSDGKYICKNTTWSLVPNNSTPPPPPCNEGDTSSNNTKLCKGGVLVTCSSAKEGQTSTDGSLVCKNGTWSTLSLGGGNGGNPQSPTIKLSKVSALPAEFNPTVGSTKISYTISKDATIDLKILNSKGETVSTLILGQKIKAGSYFSTWNGTTANTQSSPVVDAGTYTFKITAKNQTTNAIEDSFSGSINLVYSAATTQTDAEKAAATKAAADAKAQDAATLSLQNSKNGKTAKTGPDVLIYGLFPIAGYFISRKSRK